jgi:hypothetical protein
MAGFDDVRSLQSAARRLEVLDQRERPQGHATGSDPCARGCEAGQSRAAADGRVHHKKRNGGRARSATFGDGPRKWVP